MSGPNGIGVSLGLMLGVVGYYVLSTVLLGATPFPGFLAAVLFSFVGVAAAGTLVEAVVSGAILGGLVYLVFGLGSPPAALYSHGLLAAASGLGIGRLFASIPFGPMTMEILQGDVPRGSGRLEPGTAPPRLGSDGQLALALYERVRFASLTLSDRRWTGGADGLARAPSAGDSGLIVDVSEVDGRTVYTVEVFDDDANTICTAEALPEELARA